MVVADRADGVEAAQIVFVGRIVAVPGHHIERRVVDLGGPEMTAQLGHQLEIAFQVFIGGHRRLEITRVGQTVGADHAQIRQLEQLTIVFADIAARRAVEQTHLEAHAAWHHADLLRLHIEHAHFSSQLQAALLRHDQQFAIGVVEIALLHAAVGRIQMDAAGRVAGHADHALNKITRLLRHGQRVPTQLVGRRGHFVKTAGDQALPQGQLHFTEGLVHSAGANAVEPAAAVGVARRGKRRARQLLGIQAQRSHLGRIAPHGQRASDGLGGPFIGKACHVLPCGLRGCGLRGAHGLVSWVEKGSFRQLPAPEPCLRPLALPAASPRRHRRCGSWPAAQSAP